MYVPQPCVRVPALQRQISACALHELLFLSLAVCWKHHDSAPDPCSNSPRTDSEGCRVRRQRRESRQNQQIQREARARDSQLPLFQQQSVRSKMANFHDKIGTLQVSMCSTCSEKFPGMKVKSTGRMLECVRCSHDRHVPKLYSSSNNMHPGLVPLELQVSFCSTL